MIFHCKADFAFDAEDIIDALEKLAQHFSVLGAGGESTLIRPDPRTGRPGKILIEPAKEEDTA